jgi:four helix bundle protein
MQVTPKELEERTFQYGVRVMKLGMSLTSKRVSFRVIDQVVGAGTSVGANVEESHAASSRADFAYKRDIALRECRESVYWLRLLIAAGVLKAKVVEALIDEGRQISNILAKGILSTRSSMAKNT